MNVNIIGSGTWGITFANMLIKKKLSVTVLHRNSSTSKKLVNTNFHSYLPDSLISSKINYTDKFSDLDLKDITVLAIPINSIYGFISRYDLSRAKLLLLSKGIEGNKKMLISELLISEFCYNINNIAILSGPNHAEEVIKDNPTASIVASSNKSFRKLLQSKVSSSSFRIYTSDDIIGVQIGGAIKNVIAIASGMCEGLGLGDNAQATLVTRGLHEISQLSKVYKFNLNTLYGLSGLGDLACTCYSKYSRNKKIGLLLAKNIDIQTSKEKIGMVSEGVFTSKVLYEIIKKNKLNMPICVEVYKIIYKNVNIRESITGLMERTLKDEK